MIARAGQFTLNNKATFNNEIVDRELVSQWLQFESKVKREWIYVKSNIIQQHCQQQKNKLKYNFKLKSS